MVKESTDDISFDLPSFLQGHLFGRSNLYSSCYISFSIDCREPTCITNIYEVMVKESIGDISFDL